MGRCRVVVGRCTVIDSEAVRNSPDQRLNNINFFTHTRLRNNINFFDERKYLISDKADITY